MRLFATAACALCACATGSAATSEHSELKAEVRALQEDNARLEGRLTQLERQKVIERVTTAPMPSAVPAASPGGSEKKSEPKPSAEVPSLTVVKLKPRREAAPKLSTEVDVLEPSPEVVAAMKK